MKISKAHREAMTGYWGKSNPTLEERLSDGEDQRFLDECAAQVAKQTLPKYRKELFKIAPELEVEYAWYEKEMAKRKFK